ncbi:hypothetical protein ACWGB8_35500 [Kitasatospora sp. NPDC054939]
MSESQRPVLPELHEVVRDRGHLLNGRPRKGVFMELLFGVAYLRPLGGGLEWTTSARDLELCEPREIAPGTSGRPYRRLLHEESS